MIPGAFPEPRSLGRGSRGWGPAPSGTDCPLGGMVPLARGSWAEGLVLQVNLLTWWSWRAAGERGFMGSSEKLPEPGRGVAITLGRKGRPQLQGLGFGWKRHPGSPSPPLAGPVTGPGRPI